MEKEKNGAENVRAVERALDILSAFGPGDGELTVVDLLKRVDLSRRIRLLGVRVGKLVKPGTEDASATGYSEKPSNPPTRDKARHEHTDLLFPELD